MPLNGRVFRHSKHSAISKTPPSILGSWTRAWRCGFRMLWNEQLQQLAKHPELCRSRTRRHAWWRGARSFAVRGFDKHLVQYRPTGAGIEVLRLLHGARDLPESSDERADR